MRPIKIQLCLLVLIIFFHCTRDKTPLQPGIKQTGIPSSMPQYDIPWPSLANSPWPMAAVNPQGIARSPFLGPMKGQAHTFAKLGRFGRNDTGLSIGPDGTIYSCLNSSPSESGFIAIAKDGNIKWTRPWIIQDYLTGPVISADTTIYVGGYYIWALRPDGTEKWRFRQGGSFYDIRPLLNIDGAICSRDEHGNIFALTAEGKLKWQQHFDDENNLTYLVSSPDGRTIYSQRKKAITALDSQNGSILWSSLKASDINEGGPAVDCQGNIYFFAFNDSNTVCLYSISSSDELRWKTDIVGSCRGQHNRGITIDYNGYLYFSDSGTRSLNCAGKERWKVEYPICASLPILCSLDNHLYIFSCPQNSLMWCYRFDCTLEFSIDIKDLGLDPFGYWAYAAIGNGTVYAGTTSSWLVAIK